VMLERVMLRSMSLMLKYKSVESEEKAGWWNNDCNVDTPR